MTDHNQSDQQFQPSEKGYTPPVGKHKFLLFLVVFMGLLFFVGMAGLIYAVINKVDEKPAPTIPTEATSPQSVDGVNFGTLDIGKPANSNLVDYTSDGTFLTLRFKTVEGKEELVIIVMKTGKEKGRLKIVEQ